MKNELGTWLVKSNKKYQNITY